MFDTSTTTEKLDIALAFAQGQIETAVKDKTNPHFKSKYADLTSVWDACRKALSANKISVTQWPIHSDDGRLHLITRLACQGEWLKCQFSVPVNKQDPQGYGSALTYLKRYSLSAAIGVVADDDDDGNKATEGLKKDSDNFAKNQTAHINNSNSGFQNFQNKPIQQKLQQQQQQQGYVK